MAKYFCGLCGNKLGLIENYSLLDDDTILCYECTCFNNKVLVSMNAEDSFKAILEEFKGRFPEHKHARFIEHWQNIYDEKQNDSLSAEEKEQRRKQREEEQKQREEEQKQQEEQRQQYEYNLKIENLTKMGLDGYYEYKVISLLDESGFFKKKSGSVDTTAMTETLNQLGIEGWHLVTAYSNELGKNAMSGGIGGAMLGTNSTVDENILIFERFVRINK